VPRCLKSVAKHAAVHQRAERLANDEVYKNNGLLFCNRCGDEPNFPRETGGTIEGGVGLLMYFQINTVVCVCAFGLCVALGEV
jgi:hypothetical protein